MSMGDANESSMSHHSTSLSKPASVAGFLEMAFDAVVALDSRERITYWNTAAEQLYGWTAQEAVGKTPAKLFWPISTPEEKKSHKERQSRLKRGETLRDEHELCGKDRSSLRVQYALRAIFDPEGKLTGYLTIYRAIPIQAQAAGQTQESGQRVASPRAEYILQESQERLTFALERSQTGSWDLDLVDHTAYRSLQHDRIFGYQSILPRWTYEMFLEHVLPDDRAEVDRTFQEAVTTQTDWNFECRIRRVDGEVRWIWATGQHQYDSSGQARRMAGIVQDITERKQAEAQLERSNQKLNEILTSIQDDFYVLDRNWVFVYASRLFTSKTGKEPEDFVGKNIWEMFPKHIGTPFEENLRAAMEKREVRRFEIGGKYTNAWYRMTASPSAEGITVLGTDITERKRVEDALHESEERLRQMIETSPVAIGFGDSTGKIFDANMAFYRLTGYSREEIEARHLGWDQLTAPEYAELDRQIMATLAATGSAGPYEKEYIRKDGSRVPLLLTVSKLPGRDEHIAFIIDITERKRTGNALAQAMQELRMHIDNSPLAVVAFDPEFRIIEWSASAERMFGWRAEEVLNQAIPDLRWVHEDDAERVASLSADMLAGRASSSGHANRNYRKDGSVIECEWYNSAITDAHGRLISVRSQVLNVTERKRAEDALQEHQKRLQLLNETLEQKVHEKTEEVRRLASDLIQAVQHERHRISHILHDDLQQRIYAIQMQLTFLHDEHRRQEEAAGKEVADIERQLAEMLALTRHLSIDLSPPILRDEGLSHAIDWLAAQMRQRYSLPIELQANGTFAISDEALHVLLFNCVRELLFNVVKHAQASRAAVTLHWVETGLRIEVRDDGKGFPVDLPEPPASGEMNEENGLRSGLGLATIRHQLNLFGGRMEIQSEPGAGTRVILLVPVREGG